MTALDDIMALPDVLDEPDEAWWIDSPDRDPASEERRQQIFLADLKKLAPRVMAFSVPNGGKRSDWAAGKAKREGMRSGATDLVLTWAGGVAFVEFKNGVTRPSRPQRDFLNTLYRQGHPCGVFRRSASALDWLRQVGCPVGRVRHGL